MSEDNEIQNDDKPSGSKKLLVIALTVGLIAGAGVGSLVVGPLVAEGPAKSGDHGGGGAPAAGTPEQCAAILAEHGVNLAPAAVHTLDNVIVNPAQSGGTRFLMASVAFGLADSLSAERLSTRDAETRDIVVGVLSSRNVGQLSDINQRSTIKEEIRAAVAELVGEHALVDIYFPQFVIQ